MSHQQKIYFTRKCCRDEKIEKQLETESKSELEPSTFQTKLTDVNDDCLEKVFMHLSLSDLLNIAQTNTHLKPAAHMVFARKFGKKLFSFFITTSHPNTELNRAIVHDLKTALRLLRCFGHLISDSTITCLFGSHYPTAPNKVLRYTSLYCFDSLKKISLHGMHLFETSMEKPFTKTETVKFDNCVLGTGSLKFSTWFPAMRCLILKRSRLYGCSSIATHFPHLEELDFLYSDFTSEHAIAAFRLNPQLQRVSLCGLQTSEHFQSVCQYLPMLEYLKIDGKAEQILTGDTIHFKSVRKLEFRLARYVSEVISVKLLFAQLEEVDMYLSNYKTNDEPLEFFKKHPSIVKLKLDYNGSMVREYMMKIITVLPLLNDFTFFGTSLSVEEAVHFLTEFNLLIHFCFNISNRDEFHRLEATLGKEWETSINDSQRVELKRKT